MVVDNKYLLGSIGWLPEKVAYGVSLSIFPQNDRKRAFAELIIAYVHFDFVWGGWRRWPYINFCFDGRYLWKSWLL